MAFVLLGLAILLVWWPSRVWPSSILLPPWIVLFIAATLAGLAEGILAPTALASLGVMALAAFLSSRPRNGWMAGAATIVTALVALALALHILPGFKGLMVVDGLRITPDARPFTLYANFDKAAAGLFLLAFYCHRVASLEEVRLMIRPVVLTAIATMAVVLGVAWASGYVRPDFKLPPFAGAFLTINLLFTCVAEEAFFRGLIQERLIQACGIRSYPSWVPLMVSAGLFGVAHAGGGSLYGVLAGIAGLGYGLAYQRSRRIEAPLLAHYGVNLAHFFFFTYPALAG